MYRLMIVDDEEVMREKLKKSISQEKLDIELVGEAEDGIEASILFERCKPDIVLMDINLPFKNGLDVAGEILTNYSDVKIIIITGHNEFEYAQKALKIGAFDLLTKPLNGAEICSAVRKASSALDYVKIEKLRSEKLQKILLESLPILREKFVTSLLQDSPVFSAEHISERFTNLEIDIENEYYNTSVIIPEIQGISVKNNDLVLVSIKDIVEEILEHHGLKKFVFYDNLYRLIAVFSYNTHNFSKTIDDIFIIIKDKLKFYLGIDSYIGMGRETSFATHLGNSHKSACEALNYRNMYGRSNLINIEDVNEIERSKPIYSGKDIDQIIISFKTGDFEQFSDNFHSLLNGVITASCGNMTAVKRMCMELTVAVLRICSDLQIGDRRLLDAEGLYEKIIKMNQIMDIKSLVLKTCEELIAIILENRYKRVHKLVELAKQFIQENYNNEQLNLKMVSDNVGLSSIYFCQLFYQETNVHFSEYLNNVRIEQSKKQLEVSISKIYEIANEVGYKNPKYFNVIFKKKTSMTPLEYRNSYLNSGKSERIITPTLNQSES